MTGADEGHNMDIRQIRESVSRESLVSALSRPLVWNWPQQFSSPDGNGVEHTFTSMKEPTELFERYKLPSSVFIEVSTFNDAVESLAIEIKTLAAAALQSFDAGDFQGCQQRLFEGLRLMHQKIPGEVDLVLEDEWHQQALALTLLTRTQSRNVVAPEVQSESHEISRKI